MKSLYKSLLFFTIIVIFSNVSYAQIGTQWRVREVNKKEIEVPKLKTENIAKPSGVKELVVEGLSNEDVVLSGPTYLNGYYKLIVSSDNKSSYEVQDDGDKWINYLPLKDFALKGKYIGRGMFSDDFDRFYFSACDIEKPSNCNIYISVYDYNTSQWKVPEVISMVNNELQSMITPFVLTNENNKTDELFFAGSYDGQQYDIFKTSINFQGKCEMEPTKVKLPALPSEGCRIAPFVERNGEQLTLYYSEREGGSETDYDIYEYSFNTNVEPVRLTINTDANETFYFVKPENLEEGEPKLIFFMSDAGNSNEAQFNNNPGKIYIKEAQD